MPKQLKDLVTLLAAKTGLDLANEPALTDLLSANLSVSDEAFTKLEGGINNMITLEAAKNNSQLAAHFKAASLLPADTEINNLIAKLGLDDTAKGEFAAEKSTYKKIGMLVEKAQALAEAKSGAKPGDKDALQKEIDRLNAAINAEKQNAQAAIAAAKNEAEGHILNYAIDSVLGSKNYSDAIPASVRLTTAKTLLEQELQKQGLKPVRNADGSIKLVKADNPELEYYDNNNKKVGFGEFTDSILSTHAMLKVSAPAPAGGGVKKDKTITDNPENKGAEAVVAANDSNLSALEAALK